jgi:hypothetical protein
MPSYNYQSIFGRCLASVEFRQVTAKRYELHYQSKKVDVDEGVMFQQFGYVNFHMRRYRGSGARLTHTVKKKWTAGWMKV